MEDEIVVKEEATEDQVKEEVEIKQEVVMGDEDVEEEVGNRWAVEDEVTTKQMLDHPVRRSKKRDDVPFNSS
ncbi:hypothetical protein GE061_017079 [Apolygus lucorum]|uniref:Uncharacterized protein n=1 Tax=Apolygus lucorum TaxID=248454 RepID=A0A8S9XK18_APOLU|nr:hypothetical protein GE061_017079 [Apolygus lucorum]